MSEIEVTIKIPAPPEGWGYDGYRKVKPNERYWCINRWAVREPVETETFYCYPVAVKVPPPWEPPQALVDVLRPGWIAMEGRKCWYWFPCKPEYKDDSNMWQSGGMVMSLGVVGHLLPTNIPAKDTLRKIGDPQQ